MGLIGITVALTLALLAQHRLANGGPSAEVGALFLAAAVLAIHYFPRWGAESSSEVERPASPAYGDSPHRVGDSLTRGWAGPRTRRWLLATAWLAQAGALILAAGEGGWPWDGLLWGLSLLAFLVALADRDWRGSLGPFNWRECLALATLLALAFFARAYHLGRLPPAIHGDEAQFGLNAHIILRGEQPTLFAVGWYQFPIASFAAQAGVMRLFGDDIFGLRLSSAFFGTLTLLPVYLLARSIFDRRVALASAALMVVGHWPVHFSRLGINNIQTTFFAAWAVYLAWRALRMGHRLDYALTGLALGLGLYTYYAARLMPFVVGVMLLGALGVRTVRRKGLTLRRQPNGRSVVFRWGPFTKLLTLVVAGMLTVAPQVVYFVRHPEPLVSRQRGVFLFNNLPHLESVYHTEDWGQILRQQMVKSLLVFNARGDSSGQYGFDEPMLDRLTAGLMVVGLAVSAWRWRRGGHWVLHLWFWPNLLMGSVLTIDAPFVPRLVALMPVPFIWAGLALGGWWRLAARVRAGSLRSSLVSVPIVVLLILVGWTNYDAYINRYVRQRRALVDSTQAAHLLAALPASTQVYLMGAHNIYAGFGTFRFVAPDAVVWDAVNVVDWVPVRQPGVPDTIFLLWSSHMDRLSYLRSIYPEGDYQPYLDQHGHLMFATYFVPAQTIRQRQGLTASSPRTSEAVNVIWQGTLWLPDDGLRQFCLSYEPGLEGDEGGAYLQIDAARIEIPHTGGACDDFALTLDLPAGPHPVELGATAHEEAGAVMTLHWRRGEEAWEEVPRHLLWDKVWPGGLFGVFEREGGVVRRKITPLIAYRDFARELTGPVYATWTGCLATGVPGEYEFRIRSFDGARLMVDERFLIDDDHRGDLGEELSQVELEAGQHLVRLEALFTDGPRWLEWYWRPPEGEWALVPPEVLTPGVGCAIGEQGSSQW